MKSELTEDEKRTLNDVLWCILNKVDTIAEFRYQSKITLIFSENQYKQLESVYLKTRS